MLQRKHRVKEFAVTHNEYLWKAPDGKQLFAQAWDAGPDAIAVILLVHGLGEHSSRYDRWSNGFAREGYTVVSVDLQGHGKTPGKSTSRVSYSKMLDTIDVLKKQGVLLYPDKQFFIYGHGFGGNLTVNYAISRQLDISGIILTSPWFEFTKLPPRLKLVAANILGRFAPGIKIKTGIRAEDLTREIREIHLYKTDRHIRNNINIRLFMKAYEQGLIAKRSMYKINVPLLVLHGSSDKITCCKATRDFVMNAGSRTTHHEFDGGFHELHNDSENEKVFRTIIEWLAVQTKQ